MTASPNGSLLLSVVIPTKDRPDTLVGCVDALLENRRTDFQVVVHDNSADQSRLAEYAVLKRDPRLLLVQCSTPLSFSENFERAVLHATGRYIICIGDDDGLTDRVFEVAAWAAEAQLESVCCANSCEYFWPEIPGRGGELRIPDFTGKRYYYDASKKVVPLLVTGFINYIPFNLPRIYHGLIARSVVEYARKRVGRVFAGLSPDIYSSVLFTHVVRRHCLVDIPFVISGVSGRSGAAASNAKVHCGKLEDAPHLKNAPGYVWDFRVPRYYSVESIWAETAVKAIEDLGCRQELKLFNVCALIAQSLIKNSRIRVLILRQALVFCCQRLRRLFVIPLGVGICIAILGSRRAIRALRKRNSDIGYVSLLGLNSIAEAVICCNTRMTGVANDESTI